MQASELKSICLYFLDAASNYRDLFLWLLIFVLLYLYGRLRKRWWRRILASAIDYHRFHLSAIQSDRSIDEKTREYATALQWAINKQLPDDLKKGGGVTLWLSFVGSKTSLNTCGTVFYDAARYARFIDLKIIKLNDTLLSTFYRIFLIESIFFPFAIPVLDLLFIISFIKKPQSGPARLYLEMSKNRQ